MKWILYKIIGFFSIVRGYNILTIVVAQYLASIFILSENKSGYEVLTEAKLFTLIFATALAIASGYIINNFYDSEKDTINRPIKAKIDSLLSQRTKLSLYFVLNFLAVIVASYNSFNAVLFFSFYIFSIWLYSHKLKRLAVLGNIIATVLAIFPFFAIFLFYKNYDWVIFGHAHFLFLVILIREIVKDLENLKGDIAVGYENIPIKYGERVTKVVLIVLSVITIAVSVFLMVFFDLGKMDYYFTFSILLLLILIFKIRAANTHNKYLKVHNILKFLIVIGVLCIVLIRPVTVLKS